MTGKTREAARARSIVSRNAEAGWLFGPPRMIRMVTTICSRAALTVCVGLLLGACRQAPADPPAPAAAPPDATSPKARDPWLTAAGRGIDFRAVGQEPGWYLEIDNERSMHLVYDYAERTATTPVPAPVVRGDEMSYTAVTDAHRLAVLIEPRPCSDTMSGQRFPRTVTVTIDGQTLRGCGRSLTAPDSRWRVTARGLGPVRVGMTVAEASAALGMPLTGADAAGECIYVRPSRELAGVMFMVVNGAIARVDVSAGDVATEEGVRVGDSSESVRELYAGRVTASPHKYTDGEYLTIAPDAQHRIVFEVERQQVTRYRGGRLPEVEWVEGCS